MNQKLLWGSLLAWSLLWPGGSDVVQAHCDKRLHRLQKRLQHASWQQRQDAAQRLRYLQGKARGLLLQALQDKHPRVRATAASSLAHSGPLDKATAQALQKALGDPSLRVQIAVVRALGKSTKVTSALQKTLRRLLEKPGHKARLREAAALTLGELTARKRALLRVLWRAFVGKYPGARRGARRALLTLGPKMASLRWRIQRTFRKSKSPTQRAKLLTLLKAMGKRAAPALSFLLRSYKRHPKHHKAIVEILGNIRSKRALKLLKTALDKGNPAVQSAAAHALGRIGDKRALPWLRKAQSRPHTPLRQAIAQALGSFGNAGLQGLQHATKDAHPLVRVEAYRALSKLGGEQAFCTLASALHAERDGYVRSVAVRQLATFQTRATLELEDALKDPHWEVRLEAVKALQTLATLRARLLLAEHKDQHKAIQRLLQPKQNNPTRP